MYDKPTTKPPPVRVSFEFTYQRNNLLRRKSKLSDFAKFGDEPIEQRRVRGLFRRIPARARADGKEVIARSDWIKIGDVTYLPSELDKIPTEYKPESHNRGNSVSSKPPLADVSVSDTDPKLASGVEAAATGGPDEESLPVKKSSPAPNIKIKMTKAGLTFSGPTAFPSNLSRADFVFEGQPYTCSEQGYQNLNALFNDAPEIAARIMATNETKLIKELSHDIPKTEEWNKIAPSRLWGLVDAKFTQNPELIKKLLDTTPHKLIEASMDGHWGGGGGLLGLTSMSRVLSLEKMCMEKWPLHTVIRN